VVGSRSEAEELFLGKFQGAGYRNAEGFDGVGSGSGVFGWPRLGGLDEEGQAVEDPG
jgi:hypothetical protein